MKKLLYIMLAVAVGAVAIIAPIGFYSAGSVYADGATQTLYVVLSAAADYIPESTNWGPPGVYAINTVKFVFYTGSGTVKTDASVVSPDATIERPTLSTIKFATTVVLRSVTVSMDYGDLSGIEFTSSGGNAVFGVISLADAESKGYIHIIYDYGYDTGYSDGYDAGEAQGYADGYDVGWYAGYAEGDYDGYIRGDADAYPIGYEDGYNAGEAEATQSWTGLLPSVFGSIAGFFLTIFSISIWGVSLGSLVAAIGAVLLLIIVVKAIRG